MSGSEIEVVAMKIVAEQAFDLSYCDQKVWARIYEPFLKPDGVTWACRIDVGEPVGAGHLVCGETSLQALSDALRYLTVHLYTSRLWENKQLGAHGVFGGDLGIPAMNYAHLKGRFPF
jgi:hypothetical protein